MLTFDDYKAKISIIQILEDLGYKQDISKGKVSPVFKLTDGAGNKLDEIIIKNPHSCLLYTSPSPRDKRQSRMPSSA